MIKPITKKQALSTKCICGGSPKWGDDCLYNGGLYLIYCDKCGEETIQSCRIHDVTSDWVRMNKV